MNYFFFIFTSALRDFGRNKVRTLLTSLGILIGVLSVILLIAIGLGLQQYIEDQFDGLGSNTLFVAPGKLLDESGNFQGDTAQQAAVGLFDETDYERLKRIREAKIVAVAFAGAGTVQYQEEEEYTSQVYGSHEVFEAYNFEVEYGEHYTEEDVAKRSKVVVLGSATAEELFIKVSVAVGKKVKINEISYQVIGVLESKGGGGFGGPDFDSFVFIPYTTGFLVTDQRKFTDVIVKPKSEELKDVVKEKINKVMFKQYEEDEFSIIEQTQILNAVSSIFETINVVLVAIAAISLVVGGIGIMNIMYVTVTERIKEIGIRRAIGARKVDILSQFLMESVLLSLLGGLLAIALAYLIVHFIEPYFPAIINLEAVMLALGTSSAIGIVFGVFPAKKAADLSPIEAIRYE